MNAQVKARIDKIMGVIMIGSLVGLALVLVIGLSACKPAGGQPKPLKTAHQAPSPLPSWAVGMEPGCWDDKHPVAYECLEGGAPRCALRPGNITPCWWVDPATGDVWYRPGATG